MDETRKIRIVCSGIPDSVSNKNSEKSKKITVYYFPQKDFYSKINLFSNVLSSDEKKKAGAFHFADDIRNYIVCHGLLRFLISEKLDIMPDNLNFHKGANGKPFLEGNGLYFNISHTKELCAIAFSDKKEVGVDIEEIKPNTDFTGISKSYFSEEEQQQIKKSANPLDTFFLFWTRKEAFLKVIGLGLNTSLQGTNICKQTNQVNYPELRNLEKLDIGDHYFIYSDRIKDHFLSVASPEEVFINLFALTHEYLNGLNLKNK